jgi:hypothetical protein
MRSSGWRESREACLRERNRMADFIREGYGETGLHVIVGGGHRIPGRMPSRSKTGHQLGGGKAPS